MKLQRFCDDFNMQTEAQISLDCGADLLPENNVIKDGDLVQPSSPNHVASKPGISLDNQFSLLVEITLMSVGNLLDADPF